MVEQIQAFLVSPWGTELLTALLLAWPAVRILRRAGQPPAFAAVVFIPLVGVLALLALLTFRRWPPPQPPDRA